MHGLGGKTPRTGLSYGATSSKWSLVSSLSQFTTYYQHQ